MKTSITERIAIKNLEKDYKKTLELKERKRKKIEQINKEWSKKPF